MIWILLRQAVAFACLALGAWYYLGWLLAAFVLFCVYWVLWKTDPDSPFAIVAWPVWYIAGFLAAAAMLYDLIYLQPWAFCSAFVLFELYFLPIQRRDHAAFAEHYSQGMRDLEAENFEAADRNANLAYEAARRIRWRGQDARALSALMLAQTRLQSGDAAEAQRLATEALPQLERAHQVQGITPDAAYAMRAQARAILADGQGMADDLASAARVHREWAGEDRATAEYLFAEATTRAQLGDSGRAGEALREAVRIMNAHGDDVTAVMTAAAQGEPRMAYLLLVQLGRAGMFDDAIRLWQALSKTTLDPGFLLLARGQLLLEAGLYRSARQAADRAEAAMTGDDRSAALLLKAQLALTSQDWEQARALAERAEPMITDDANRESAAIIKARCDSREVDPRWTMTPERVALDAGMMLP